MIVPVLELSQVTFCVIFAVEPSEYMPVAVNWKVEPTVTFGGEDGDISMEDSLGAVFDEHAAIPTIKIVNNSAIKQYPKNCNRFLFIAIIPLCFDISRQLIEFLIQVIFMGVVERRRL